MVIKFGIDREGNTLQVLRQVPLKQPGIADAAVRHDGLIFATAGWDHAVRVFGCKKLKLLAVLKVPRTPS